MYITYAKTKCYWLQEQVVYYLLAFQEFSENYIPLYMQKKIFYIIRHFVTVFLFLFFPLIIFREEGLALLIIAFSNPFYWLFCISLGLLFYFNYYYLIPRFYIRKRYGRYFLSVFLLFVFFYFLKPFDLMIRYYYVQRKLIAKVPSNEILAIDLFTCVFFFILVSFGMAVQAIRQWRSTEMRAAQAETEKANAELSFLKAQINPHFLFNTLNNIYSLSVDQRPETSDAIMKLSNIMRYITDEATKDFVPLQNEINCISDFIDLHKLRLHKNITVDFSISGNVEEKQIAPLILMTYIENVFKYGISSHENARITIKLHAEENKINFFCQNKIFSTPRTIERTGVGLVNTEKRLKHLYPDKHNLTITGNNGYYTVDLTLYA